MKTRLTFLGTGTSQGVPIIGCQCPVCKSIDPHDNRFRSAALVEYGGLTILVDAGPDFRMQMLAHGVSHLDAILLTHSHRDHTGGLDDVRSLNYIDQRAAEIYCESKVLDSLKEGYSYVFAENKYPGAPEWHIHLIDERPFFVEQFQAEIPEYEYRHNVRPGITGMAQVNGKYNTTVYDKLVYDLMYVQICDIFTDLVILVQTVRVLFIKSSTEGV